MGHFRCSSRFKRQIRIIHVSPSIIVLLSWILLTAKKWIELVYPGSLTILMKGILLLVWMEKIWFWWLWTIERKFPPLNCWDEAAAARIKVLPLYPMLLLVVAAWTRTRLLQIVRFRQVLTTTLHQIGQSLILLQAPRLNHHAPSWWSQVPHHRLNLPVSARRQNIALNWLLRKSKIRQRWQKSKTKGTTCTNMDSSIRMPPILNNTP